MMRRCRLLEVLVISLGLLPSFAMTARSEDLASLGLMLESDSEQEREHATRKIGDLGVEGAPAVPAIVCMLYIDADEYRWFNPQHRYMRMQYHPGVRALVEVGVAAVPTLVRVLEKGPFRYFGARWGGEPCPSREHDPTWDGDLDTWIDFTGFVQLALEQIGEPAIQPVVQALERSKGNVEWLLRPLEMWGEEASRAVPALLRGLQEAEPHLRAGFIRTLGAIGPRAEEAVAVLKDLLDDPPVSAYAQRALDQIQPN